MTPTQEGIAAVPKALHRFLHEIIDYAGLFPPARLPLADAIERYARDRVGRHAWMLGRFVIPVDRLPQLSAHSTLFRTDPPFRFSVLGTGGDTAGSWLAHLLEDVAAMTDFEMHHGGRVQCEVMEIRLSQAYEHDLRTLVGSAAQLLAEHNRADVHLYLEVPWQEEHDALMRACASAVAEARSARSAPFGLKIRTGGLEPSMFPDVGRLAEFLAVCSRLSIPFKATAGLHHPVRHCNESVAATMHGFLNVFGAGVLLHAGLIDRNEIVPVLEDQEPASFVFTREHFGWKDRLADASAVAAARAFATSFGSCSFDEPRDDLRALHIL